MSTKRKTTIGNSIGELFPGVPLDTMLHSQTAPSIGKETTSSELCKKFKQSLAPLSIRTPPTRYPTNLSLIPLPALMKTLSWESFHTSGKSDISSAHSSTSSTSTGVFSPMDLTMSEVLSPTYHTYRTGTQQDPKTAPLLAQSTLAQLPKEKLLHLYLASKTETDSRIQSLTSNLKELQSQNQVLLDKLRETQTVTQLSEFTSVEWEIIKVLIKLFIEHGMCSSKHYGLFIPIVISNHGFGWGFLKKTMVTSIQSTFKKMAKTTRDYKHTSIVHLLGRVAVTIQKSKDELYIQQLCPLDFKLRKATSKKTLATSPGLTSMTDLSPGSDFELEYSPDGYYDTWSSDVAHSPPSVPLTPSSATSPSFHSIKSPKLSKGGSSLHAASVVPELKKMSLFISMKKLYDLYQRIPTHDLQSIPSVVLVTHEQFDLLRLTSKKRPEAKIQIKQYCIDERLTEPRTSCYAILGQPLPEAALASYPYQEIMHSSELKIMGCLRNLSGSDFVPGKTHIGKNWTVVKDVPVTSLTSIILNDLQERRLIKDAQAYPHSIFWALFPLSIWNFKWLNDEAVQNIYQTLANQKYEVDGSVLVQVKSTPEDNQKMATLQAIVQRLLISLDRNVNWNERNLFSPQESTT